MRSWSKPLSWLLILGGLVLLSMGARDFLGSIFGQREAASRWQDSQAQPARVQPELGAALAKLSIPRLDAEWFVFEGIDKKELRLGPGHLPGTAQPGATGNCVIAGHRDTHFRALKDVRQGDELVVETRAGKFRYRVTNLSVVRPSNTTALAPSSDAVLNLITCYPFYYVGPAPKRFVVRAEKEPVEIAHSGPGTS
jgi:sortase A